MANIKENLAFAISQCEWALSWNNILCRNIQANFHSQCHEEKMRSKQAENIIYCRICPYLKDCTSLKDMVEASHSVCVCVCVWYFV